MTLLLLDFFRAKRFSVTTLISRYALLTVALIALNILFSINPFVSIYKYLRLFLYFQLYLYLVRHHTVFLKDLTKFFPWTILWVSLLAIAQFVKQANLGGLLYWLGERPLTMASPQIAKVSLGNLGLMLRSYATLPHPNALAGFLLLSFLILLIIRKKLPLFLGAVSTVAIFLTFSKAAIVLWFLILCYLVYRRDARLLFLFLPMCLLLLWFLPHIIYPASINDRLSLSLSSLNIFSTHPLFGIGLGTYPLRSVINYQPVHNIFLLALCETGFILFTLLLIQFFIFIKQQLRHQYIFISLLAIIFTGLLDHYWITLVQNLLLLTIFMAAIKSVSIDAK